MERIDSITEAIIGGAIVVHRELGPGLLESTYESCLASLLSYRGLNVERQLAMPVIFRGQQIDPGYRIDLLVENRVVVELETVAKLERVHFAQVMTYLKLSRCEVGLLINFNVALLKEGLRRIVRREKSPFSSIARASSVSAIDSVESVDSVDSVDSPDPR